MFLVSAALVGVAIVLLLLGMVMAKLTLVYLAIGVSVVSMILLGVGVFLQRELLWGKERRRSGETGTEGSAEPAEEPEPVSVASAAGARATTLTGSHAPAGGRGSEGTLASSRGGATGPAADELAGGYGREDFSAPAAGPDEPAAGELVHVVPGRRRYHHAGCASLAGRVSEELTIDEAREEGFTACTTCFPGEAEAEPEAEPDGNASGAKADGWPGRFTAPARAGLAADEARQAEALHNGAKRDMAEPEAADTAPSGKASGTASGMDTGPGGMPVPGSEAPRPEEQATPAHGIALGDAAPAAPAASGAAGANGAYAPTAGPEDGGPGGTEEKSPSSNETVWVVRGVSRYHRNDCVLIRSVDEEDVDTMTQAEAEADGCTPCRACHAIDEPLAG